MKNVIDKNDSLKELIYRSLFKVKNRDKLHVLHTYLGGEIGDYENLNEKIYTLIVQTENTEKLHFVKGFLHSELKRCQNEDS